MSYGDLETSNISLSFPETGGGVPYKSKCASPTPTSNGPPRCAPIKKIEGSSRNTMPYFENLML